MKSRTRWPTRPGEQDAALYATDVKRASPSSKRDRALRQSAHADMTAESERMRRETEIIWKRVQEQAVQKCVDDRAAKDELRK